MFAKANVKSIEEINPLLSCQKGTYKVPYETHPTGLFNMRIDNTTCVIGVRFSKTSKETMEYKMKCLMRDDAKLSNF